MGRSAASLIAGARYRATHFFPTFGFAGVPEKKKKRKFGGIFRMEDSSWRDLNSTWVQDMIVFVVLEI